MKDLNVIVWLFPVLFMLHDFEEIILVEAWKKCYKNTPENPRAAKLVFSGCKNTPAFSIGVALEFLLFSIASYLSCVTNFFGLWYALFFGFIIHLAGHGITTVLYKHYVPGIVTSILLFPYCTYLLHISGKILAYSVLEKLVYCGIGIILMLLLILGLHACMNAFAHLIEKFSRTIVS